MARIAVIASLFLMLTSTLPAYGDTSTLFLDWTGGHCLVCGGDYACAGPDFGTYGNWKDGEATFNDPTPPTAGVISVSANARWVSGCAENSADVELMLNSTSIARKVFTGGNCACGDCNDGVFPTASTPGGWPGYVKGGLNTLKVIVHSGVVCLNGVDLVIEWTSCGDAGEACDDGDACTQTDQCDGAGTCEGLDPVVCTALDQCHDIGTCDPVTGVCDSPEKSDSSACDDGDACTLDDTCQAGVCEPGEPTLLNPLTDPDRTLQCLEQTAEDTLP